MTDTWNSNIYRICLCCYCSFTRIWSTILRICGSKPMSSIRSASSRTRYVQRRRLVFPASRKSIKRPGVAMQTSTPRETNRKVIYITVKTAFALIQTVGTPHLSPGLGFAVPWEPPHTHKWFWCVMTFHSRVPPAGPAAPVLLWGPEPNTTKNTNNPLLIVLNTNINLNIKAVYLVSLHVQWVHLLAPGRADG